MIYANDFDLRLTVESGQPLTFHGDYNATGRRLETLSYVTDKGRLLLDCAKGGNRDCMISYSYVGDYTRASAEREIRHRLGLTDDLQEIYTRINTDRFMDAAINDLYGMRVTHNDQWETTLCFLVSQFNNIKRIRLIIKRLIHTYGEELAEEGEVVRLFPSSDTLSRVSAADLMRCGTGFRARYIRSVAEQCTNNFDLSKLSGMGYRKAKAQLMELDGIGDKVADCILLFGYAKYEAFPIDVWIKRVMERTYFGGRKMTIKAIHAFAEKRWGCYQGYGQQYIFESGRRNKIGKLVR